MSAATMNEMDRLVRERDEARAERDALAAHVERLAGLWNAFCMCHEDEHGAYGARLNAAFGEAPAASLARLKAQWQVEAVETAVARGYRSRDELAGWAEHLRRQSEEAS